MSDSDCPSCGSVNTEFRFVDSDLERDRDDGKFSKLTDEEWEELERNNRHYYICLSCGEAFDFE